MVVFSIVIPVYPPDFNEIPNLIKNINDFVCDSCSVSEVVIACSETTEQDVKQFFDTSQCKFHVIVSASPNKCNAATNRNRGWEHCTGEWVVFLDSDDLYHPLKLKITDLAISDFPNVNLILHSYLYRNEASPSWYTDKFSEVEYLGPEDIRSNTFPEGEYTEITHVESGNTNLRLSSKTARIHHGISTVRRNVSVRFPEHFNIGEDGYFCRKVCWEYSGVVFVNLGLMIYRN